MSLREYYLKEIGASLNKLEEKARYLKFLLESAEKGEVVRYTHKKYAKEIVEDIEHIKDVFELLGEEIKERDDND